MNELQNPYRNTPEIPDKTPHQILLNILDGEKWNKGFSTVHGDIFLQRMANGNIQFGIPFIGPRFTIGHDTDFEKLDKKAQDILSSLLKYSEISYKYEKPANEQDRLDLIAQLLDSFATEDRPEQWFGSKRGMIHIKKNGTMYFDPKEGYQISIGNRQIDLDKDGKILHTKDATEKEARDLLDQQLNEALASATLCAEEYQKIKEKKEQPIAEDGSIKKIKNWVAKRIRKNREPESLP